MYVHDNACFSLHSTLHVYVHDNAWFSTLYTHHTAHTWGFLGRGRASVRALTTCTRIPQFAYKNAWFSGSKLSKVSDLSTFTPWNHIGAHCREFYQLGLRVGEHGVLVNSSTLNKQNRVRENSAEIAGHFLWKLANDPSDAISSTDFIVTYVRQVTVCLHQVRQGRCVYTSSTASNGVSSTHNPRTFEGLN